MHLLLQNLAVTTGIFVLLAIVIAMATFRYLRHAYGHDSRTQFESVVVGLAVTVLFSVILNHLYAEKRQLESRLWSIQDQHFVQLKQVLRSEAEMLRGLSDRLKQSAQPYDYKVSPQILQQQINTELWRDVLSQDLKNHFPQYQDKKTALASDLEAYTAKFNSAVSGLDLQFRGPGLDDHWREVDAHSYIEQCIGHGNGVTLIVLGNSFNFNYSGSSFGGSGAPSQDLVTAYEAYKSLKPKKDQQAICQVLRSTADDLAKRVDQLSKEVLLIADETSLPGKCEFIDLNLP